MRKYLIAAGATLVVLAFATTAMAHSGQSDDEFHARMNNTTTPGTQTVVWCYDPDANGCADERVDDKIKIEWTQ